LGTKSLTTNYWVDVTFGTSSKLSKTNLPSARALAISISALRELLGFMRIPTRLADYRPRKPFADHSEMPLLKYGQSVLLHGSKVSGDRLF
jgi:hypothetical protein